MDRIAVKVEVQSLYRIARIAQRAGQRQEQYEQDRYGTVVFQQISESILKIQKLNNKIILSFSVTRQGIFQHPELIKPRRS